MATTFRPALFCHRYYRETTPPKPPNPARRMRRHYRQRLLFHPKEVKRCRGALLTQSSTHPHYAPIQPLCEKWAARKISLESSFVTQYTVSTASFLLTFCTGFIGLKKIPIITTIRQTRQRLRSWNLCFSVGHHKGLLWRNRISTFVCNASVFPKRQSIHDSLAGLTQSFRSLCRNRNRSLVYFLASCKPRPILLHKGTC